MVNKELRFEDALKKLEEIVERLEAGNVSLDESLAAYEEGMRQNMRTLLEALGE